MRRRSAGISVKPAARARMSSVTRNASVTAGRCASASTARASAPSAAPRASATMPHAASIEARTVSGVPCTSVAPMSATARPCPSQIEHSRQRASVAPGVAATNARPTRAASKRPTTTTVWIVRPPSSKPATTTQSASLNTS